MSTNTTKPRTTVTCATAGDATAVGNLLSEPRIWAPGGVPTVTVSGTTVTVLGSGNTVMMSGLIAANLAGTLSADAQLYVDQVAVAGP